MKFRKKPIVIEAEQFFPDRKPWPDGVMEYPYKKANGKSKVQYRMMTLEGVFDVIAGDWIITGIVGERYPCKDDIFKDSYDQVDE